MMVTIVIADDHDIIREGIKNILRGHKTYKVVGEAGNGEDALRLTAQFKPAALLLDISMPKSSGLDILQQVHYASPQTKVIIISVHRANIYLSKAFKLGVKGYLHKENVVEELLPALKNILRGEVYVSPKVSTYIVDKVVSGGREACGGDEELTGRENDILRLLVEGKTAKQIAHVLFISPRTVENYKNNMLKKLGLHRTSDLIKYALQHNIVETED